MQFKKDKRSKLMRKIAAICMTLVMVLTIVPVTGVDVHAAANDVVVSKATYYESGAVKSLTTTFGWDTAGAAGRLVLMTEKLADGELTDIGSYGNSFKTWDDVIDHEKENGTFGIIDYSGSQSTVHGDNTYTFDLNEGAIPLDKNATYYVYLWTEWFNNYYPDYLITTVEVKDGTVKYKSSGGSFEDVVREQAYDVTVVPGDNMTRDEQSGAAVQENLKNGMTPVVYEANDGYIFPENYSVATKDGIMIERISESQIKVYGTPTADTTITLKAPEAKKVIKDLEDMVFEYAYDAQRSNSFPVKDEEVTLSGLSKPLIDDDGSRKNTNEGVWTLSKVGTYSEFKSKNTPNRNLKYVLDEIMTEYGLDSMEGIVLHELKDGEDHIAYGVVVAYNADEEVAVFIGDTHSTGGGYLLSVDSVTGRKTVIATEVATDWVAKVYKVNMDDTANTGKGTTTVSAAEAVEGVSVTITAEPAEGYKLDKITVVDADNNNVAVTDNKFVMPASDVTVKAEYVKQEFTVTYVADGKVVATQTVEYGKDATAPTAPAKEGYTVVWDKDGKNIIGDTTITAVYTAVPAAPTPEAPAPAPAEPQTGDDFNTMVFWLIALAAMMTAGGTVMVRRKSTK